ncbi:MAG: SUMF1/EgtB/PvdO family nonheme iron enzyme [Chloroflexota bacterium]
MSDETNQVGDQINNTNSHNQNESGNQLIGNTVGGNINIGDTYIVQQPDLPTIDLPFEPELVFVPEGTFLMGTDEYPAESPSHTVSLANYAISKYPITNLLYFEFVCQTNYDVPNKRDWFLGQPLKNRQDLPVVGVSWHDALAYCHWLSEQTRKTYRLPTEAEWEKAARGPNGRLYPWGNDWRDKQCNQGNVKLTAVNAYDHSSSHYDCVDLIGNVQQWTSTLWGDDRKVPQFSYPYQHDEREQMEAEDGRFRLRRIVRGASYSDSIEASRLTNRRSARPQQTTLTRGFRIVQGQ